MRIPTLVIAHWLVILVWSLVIPRSALAVVILKRGRGIVIDIDVVDVVVIGAGLGLETVMRGSDLFLVFGAPRRDAGHVRGSREKPQASHAQAQETETQEMSQHAPHGQHPLGLVYGHTQRLFHP